MNSVESPGNNIVLWAGRHSATLEIVCVVVFVLLSFGRIFVLRDVNVDDNCWLLAIYNTHDLSGFLDMGARELRRVPQGILGYYFWVTHTFFRDPLFIWQCLNLAIQAASAVCIYFLVRAFTGGLRLCAFAAVCFFVIAPVDTTLPIFTNVMTRTGVLLSIISLLCTVKAVYSDKKWPYLVIAFIVAILTSNFMVEAAISLEPGRFVMLMYLFYAGGSSVKDSFKKSALIVLPFVLASLPLVAYKLMYKPVGVYGGSYGTDFRFLLLSDNWRQVIQHFAFDNWVKLGIRIDGFPVWPLLLGAAGGLVSWFGLKHVAAKEAPASAGQLNNKAVFVLGFVLLIFPVLFYMYAGKVPTYGADTRHGILMQIGNAVMLGGLLGWLFNKYGRRGSFLAFVALFFSVGVFFTNVNLDQYFKAWRHKAQFWQAFTERFPVLPEKADFVFDVDTSRLLYRYYADYDFEYPLNMLYARSTARGNIRKYRVVPADTFTADAHTTFTRTTHFGKDVFDTKTLIPVAFRDGRLYVGKETLALGDISYRVVAGNPLPTAPSGPLPAYPMRIRFPGYLQ